MDFEENMVEDIDTEEAAEDSLSDEVVEEPADEGEELESLEESAEEETQEEPKGTTEPGYVHKRISKAVSKAVAETEARFVAQMEAMEARYAPIMERLMEMDAQELVRSRKVGDIETARELVRLRQGMSMQTEEAEEPQPRNANGQFASAEDLATTARIEMLRHQRERIIANGGPDPAEGFNSDETIKNAVIKGEMDFYDVAQQMRKRKRPPSPMRSPNGASGTNPNAIDTMSDAQFEKMEKRIKEGARYKLK